jgi:hypothetical protein
MLVERLFGVGHRAAGLGKMGIAPSLQNKGDGWINAKLT